MRTFLRDILPILIIAAIIFFGQQVTIQKSVVDGSSMNPNFHDGQQLLVNKVAYDFHIGNKIVHHFREPERGEVIVFHPPASPQDDYIKRIIGLPGESVEIKDGIVYIHKEDGQAVPLHEPYVAEQAKLPFKGDTIPENEYFVMGDNRNNSGDSRNGWTVKHEDIIGKAWLSLWPPEKWGLVANHSFKGERD